MIQLRKYLNPRLTFLLLFHSVIVTAQNYDSEFKNFPKPKDLTTLILTEDCLVCTPPTKNDTLEIYQFDSTGKIIHSDRFIHREIYNFKDYSYNSDNTLKHTKEYGRWDYGTIMDAPIKPIWDSVSVTGTENYYYENGKLIKHLIYKEKEILKYEIRFFYDAKNNVVKEQQKEFISAYPWQKDSIIYKKEYQKGKGISSCKYYENESLKSIETSKTNSRGQVISLVLKDNEGNEIRKRVYKYNTKNQLLTIESKSNGFDEYGHPSGLGIEDGSCVYIYDAKGSLIKKDEYYQGKLVITHKLIYQIKK